MSRKLPPTQLSKLIGGVHSQEAEARGDIRLSPDRCVSALNVEEKDGYLKRRPAFKPIAHGPQFIFPAGQSVVYTVAGGMDYGRTFSVAGASFTAGTYIYVGCDNQFDGIEIPDLEATPSSDFTSHGYLKVEFQDTVYGWTEFYQVVDFTRGRRTDSSDNVYIHTLTQPGTVVWSPSEITWDQTTISSVTKYWIRLSVVNGAGTQIAYGSTANLEIYQPGILPFELEPVSSILPARYRNGKSVLFFGGDRRELRGSELGCNISAWTQLNKAPKIGFKVEDWGAGLWDADTMPATWLAGDPSSPAGRRVWPTDFPTAADSTNYWLPATAGGTPSVGETNDRLIKSDQTYDWVSGQDAAADDLQCQFRGGCFRYALAPSSVTSNDTTAKRCTLVFSASDLNVAANELEHFFIKVVASGSGPAAGEEVQIISNTTTTIVTYPEFSALPTTSTTFHIYKPHCRVQYGESVVNDYIKYNFPHYLIFLFSGAVAPFNFQAQSPGWYHFYVGREMQWAQDRGLFWNSVYDPISAKHILTNGRGPLLEWDGKYFKELTALTDPDSVAVQQYTGTYGAFDDYSESVEVTSRQVKGSLHQQPPTGKYLASFAQKILVADDKFVRWSVAYDTNIWPRKFEQEIRDPFSNSITGLEVLGDRAVVFTPTAIFSSPFPDQAGMLNFQIESTGIGFSSGRGVARIYINGAPCLIGPTADGVRIYSPGSQSPVPVIDSWSQVLPEGVNLGMLSKCVGAVSKFENRYYLAVPRAGYTTLDTILVFDFVTKAWWVWRYPGDGIACISRDFDETGKERILFGGNDGLVCTMVEAHNDYGGSLTPTTVSWSALSPPIEFRGNTIAPVAMMIRGDESTVAMTITTYINGRVTEDDTASLTIDDGSPQYDVASFSDSPTYSSEGDVVSKVNLQTGTRCTSFQYKLSGVGRFKFKGAELLATVKGQRGKQ